MILKTGIRVAGIRPEILLALIIAERIFHTEVPAVEMVVTDITGDNHGRASLHYVGLAVDLRIRGISKETILIIVERLQAALGENYDVVLESDHIHIEFQPK